MVSSARWAKIDMATNYHKTDSGHINIAIPCDCACDKEGDEFTLSFS